jgi:hypothetical protein
MDIVYEICVLFTQNLYDCYSGGEIKVVHKLSCEALTVRIIQYKENTKYRIYKVFKIKLALVKVLIT